MNLEYSEAIVEILDILNHTEKSLVQKIPDKLIEFWNRNADPNYKVILDYNVDLKDMKMKSKTKALIGMIYRNYWCDLDERKKYDELLKQNEEEFQKKSREKYNTDDIFKNDKKELTYRENKFEIRNVDNEAMIKYKENVFQKIIDKIKALLNIN